MKAVAYLGQGLGGFADGKSSWGSGGGGGGAVSPPPPPMDMKEVLSYSLGPVPWSLATAEGAMSEREREKDGSDVTIVALKLAMSFALLLAKNVHLSIDEEFCAIPCQKICTSVSPLSNGAEFTLSVAKNVALFETVRILRTVKWRD